MRRVAGIAIALAVLTACGGDGTTPAAGGSSPASPRASGAAVSDHGTKDATSESDVTIEIDDRYFAPTFLKAKPGQKLTVELQNEGSLPHTFTISSLDVDEGLQPGTKKEIVLSLPPGSVDVTFLCRFHESAGMRGAFFFGAAPAVAPTSGSGYRY